MHLQYTPFALLAFVAATISALLALLGDRRRPAPGAAWFSLLMLSLAWWSLGYAFELLSVDLAAIVFWAKVQYVGITAVPVLWLTLVLAYTDRSKWLTRRNLTFLFIVPVLTLLLVWTNEFHELIWMNVTLNTDGRFVRMDFSRGPWYWVNVIYAYALILLSILLLLRSLLRSRGLYRRQFAALLIGSLFPWLGNLIYMTGLSFSHLDLTPFAFTLTGLSGGWGLLHYRLLDIVPVARDAVIESMGDAVMVLNAQNHLVDLNPAAQEIIGQPAREVIGQPAGRVLSDWPALVEQYQNTTEAHTEITAATEEGKRHLDLSISPLYDRRGRLTGRLIVFRDITERKQVEEELKTYQEQLEELVQVRTKELTQTNEQLVKEIDERKRVEEALRYSEQNLVRAQSIAHIGSWDWDIVDNTLAWSDELYRVFGVSPKSFELTYDNIASMIHPDDRDRNEAKVQELLTTADRVDYEFRIIRPDGLIRHIYQMAEISRDGEGESQRAFGIVMDITERKQAEEALRHERDLMHTLMDNIPDSIYFKDASSRFTRINLAQAKMLGCATPEDALGKTDLDFYAPEFAQETLGDERRIITTGQAQSGKVEQLRWPDGRVRWGSASKAPIRDSQGQVIGIVGITRDITERIQAEEALTQRVGQLELLNQVSRHLTAELSLDYLLSNAASLIQESFGYPHIGLFLVEHEPEELVMKARAGSYAELFPLNHRLTLDEGINGWVARNGQRLLIGDVRKDPRYYNPFPEQLILSELSVPIIWRGEVVGVLDIQSDRLDAFDSNDVIVLETLADQLAAAIQNASLLIQMQLALVELMAAEAAEREQRALAEALADVAAKLNSTLDFEEVLEQILENVGYIASYDSANIMLLEKGIARVVRQKGRREETEKLIWTVAETPTLSQMVKKNEPVAIPDTQSDPIWVETIPWIRSYAGAPIRLNEEVIGFISLNGARPDMFTTEQAQRLQAFANQTAIAIANARLYHELEVYSGILEQAVEERTAELQQTKERVETILNYSPDPILLLKSNGVIEAANPAFKEVFGYHIDDLYRQPPTRLIVDEQAGMIQNALQNAITKRMVTRLELVARRQDETTFDADVALAPIRENEDLLGIVCNVRDISALKEVERMKDAFVSNVSHELRTPITSLKLSHRLLQMDPDNQETYMGRLSREINRLNDLIEDLLRLSRLDQGRVELNLQPVDLNELAQQYVNDRGPLAENKELALLFEEKKDVVPVQADEGLIGQVLSILLTNALNYTPAGGQVTVSTHMKELGGKLWVGYSVSDTGLGITPDDQAHLFERFYRGKAGHDSGAPGTGLGLAIAHEIVEQHRGKIDVESEGVPGKGTTFTVWLPVRINRQIEL
jgi:PAS domain S-box-containing protein